MKNDFYHQLLTHYSSLKYKLLEAQTFSKAHFGFPPIYYKVMETDEQRIGAFTKAFKQYDFTNKVVCEAGAGTLALSKYFLPVVKRAYLIENNPNLIGFLQNELAKAGWLDKVELVFGDARRLTLPEPVDYVVGELMSIFCANEYQVQVFKNLRRYLKPGGKLLPEFITNVVQLAHANFEEDHKHYPINFTRHLPQQLSLQQPVNTINLYTVQQEAVATTLSVSPILTGVANCVYMHSLVQVAENCNFTGTDSLMPPTVCRLEQPVQLVKGKEVELHLQFRYGSSLDTAKFWVAT